MPSPRIRWLDDGWRLMRSVAERFAHASLWGLLGVVLGLACLGAFTFDRYERRQLRKEASDYLAAVTSLKAREIDAWLGERRGDAVLAGRAPGFSQAVAAHLAGKADSELDAAAIGQAVALRKVYRYSDVFLLTTDGRLLIGTDPDPEGLSGQTAVAVRAALDEGAPRFSDLWVGGDGAAPLIDLVAPLEGPGDGAGRVIGVVVLRMDPRVMLWPLLTAWPDASYDGQLMLVRQEGADQLLFDVSRAAGGDVIGPRRARVAPGSAYEPMPPGQLVRTGYEDSGREVLAAARGVAGWAWTLVVTIPVADVEARVERATLLAMGWLVALLGGAAVLARRYARRLSDDAVRASEELLRISQALAHSGSWEYNLRTASFAFSAELTRLLGFPIEPPPTPRRLLRLVPVPYRRALLGALRVALREGTRVSLEHDVRRPDGQVRIVQHEANRHADANSVRLVGVILDVTERRQAERALRESEAALENVFEHMQDAFVRVEFGGAGRVLDANPAAMRMLGWEQASELIGKSVLGELAVNPDEARSLWKALLQTGVAHNQRFTLRRRDGSHVLVEGNVRLLKDADQRPCALEGVLRDMSLHYQRQAELVAAREAALGAAEAKARFLANISHEIRTPLNAIVGLSHLLSAAALPARERDTVQKLKGSTRSLLELINGVLDFSKLEAGKLRLAAAPFFLDEVLDAVTNVVAVEAQQKGLRLSFALTDAVPVALVGDSVRLRQVLTNLAHNAVKFTNAGEIVVGVELVESHASRARLRFSVRDTGIGIAADDIPKLFAAFTQADDSATRRFGGTGLGLAISAELVQLMGGDIEVRSTPGVGSTFSFVIDLPLSTEQRPAQHVRPVLGPARVLVVDDHTASLMVLGRYLRDLGFSVESARSGAEALQQLNAAEARERPFDLLLLDWRLPGPDGIDTARSARHQLRSPPPIILVTAHDVEAGDPATRGVEAVLSKPVTRSALLDAIARVRGQIVTPPEVEAPPSRLRGARVLVAEDNEINQQVARQLLESAGIEVQLADNGRDAVTAATAADARYDAILMDLQMPIMDGYEATRAIRNDPRGATLPIIAMTAHTLALEKERCRQAGMNAHVAKPIDPTALFATLAEWIRRPGVSSPPVFATLDIPGIDCAAALRRVRDNRALLLRLLGELARTWRDGAVRIRQQLDKSEGDEARRTAHTLRGAAANLGANGIADAASRVERALGTADPLATDAAIVALTTELAQVCAALDERLPALTA